MYICIFDLQGDSFNISTLNFSFDYEFFQIFIFNIFMSLFLKDRILKYFDCFIAFKECPVPCDNIIPIYFQNKNQYFLLYE